MKEIIAFGCDYCAMTSRLKGSVKRHEAESCRKNKDRVTCNNCKNLEFDDPEDGYYCDKIMNHIEHPLNMTLECKFFSYK